MAFKILTVRPTIIYWLVVICPAVFEAAKRTKYASSQLTQINRLPNAIDLCLVVCPA